VLLLLLLQLGQHLMVGHGAAEEAGGAPAHARSPSEHGRAGAARTEASGRSRHPAAGKVLLLLLLLMVRVRVGQARCAAAEASEVRPSARSSLLLLHGVLLVRGEEAPAPAGLLLLGAHAACACRGG
jgi:hypothetical protein